MLILLRISHYAHIASRDSRILDLIRDYYSHQPWYKSYAHVPGRGASPSSSCFFSFFRVVDIFIYTLITIIQL